MAVTKDPTIKIVADPSQDPLSTLSSIVVEGHPDCDLTGNVATIKVLKKKRIRSRQKYRTSWEDDPSFHSWLTSDPTNEYKAVCKACNVKITADITVVKNHSKGMKHCRKLSEYKADRARPRVRKRMKIKKEPGTYVAYSDEFNLSGPVSPADIHYVDASPSARTPREAKMRLLEFINDVGLDRNNLSRAKNLLNQCFYQEQVEDLDELPDEV